MASKYYPMQGSPAISEPVTALQSDPKPVHQFEPLVDLRWVRFVQRHHCSSVFHTVKWLSALHRTYGYEPIGFTTSPPEEELNNAAIFCRIDSWLTGSRLVSLPFSDHCDVLADSATDEAGIVSVLRGEMRRSKLRYVEIRPTRAIEDSGSGAHSTYSFCLHRLDLRPDIDTLFGNCHKSSTQRKIRRAEREGLVYEEGRSDFLVASFRQLLLTTRRRHSVPPQPRAWFQNLIESFGENLKIRIALKDKRPIAAILTLRHKNTLVYKYGCSDAAFHPLGGMHFLMWKSIEEAKREGLSVFDLGRSEWDNTGLIAFKDRWGAARSMIVYSRLVASADSKEAFTPAGGNWQERTAKRSFLAITGFFCFVPRASSCSATSPLELEVRRTYNGFGSADPATAALVPSPEGSVRLSRRRIRPVSQY